MRKIRLASVAFLLLVSFVFYWKYSKSDEIDRHFFLAHNLATEHPVHLGMEYFAKRLFVSSQGKMKVTIFPNGQIGTEKAVLELVQLGAISMTKVSSLSLESFSPLVGILNLPFLFRDRDHHFSVLDSEVGEVILSAGASQNLRGLTYYDAGDRSFYASKPIRTPSDVVGLKIRVMENRTAIRMMQLLGGSPTPMPYGEVYTALQQGVIDGAENNLTALTVNRHGEVSKYYSLVQHIFAPDILVVSERIWNDLNPEEAQLIKNAAEESKVFQRKLWEKNLIAYRKEAEEKMGVEFIIPQREGFIELVKPLHEEFEKRGPQYLELIRSITHDRSL